MAMQDTFARRHNGPRTADVQTMLETVGATSVEDLIRRTVPADILLDEVPPNALPPAMTESEVLARLAELAGKNEVWRS